MADDKFKDEILNDEQLDSVAGGEYSEINLIRRYLDQRYDIKISDDRYTGVGEISKLFKEAGIDMYYNDEYSNSYVIRSGNNRRYLELKEALNILSNYIYNKR